ncbi:molecular chaperone DnaJ [Desulfuromonas versatilis]|uniref:Molecular chaperone DnaJ n=1 Tax=Desulfuromonas versatilis TaxID=2802975 RepID=A0ABN6DU23_9BACT|nr:J domain-containing protein [Desulfuromonas versatilis]BCR03617.1 molecular chaperone DnaJ [Desulfuromonas versatilis]
MDFEELRQALIIFNLSERASLEEIKDRYRELVKRHHPDRETGEDSERIRAITAAYRTLRKYCGQYRYCFSREEFYEQYPVERLRAQFGYDPLWGGRGPEKE